MTRKTTSKRKKKTAATGKDAASDSLVDEKTEAAVASDPKPEDPPLEAPKAEQIPVETRAQSPKPPRRASTGFIGWLALVLALGAVTGVAYLVFESWRAGSSDQESNAAITDLDNTVDATRDSLASLEQRLERLAGRDVASVGDLQSMERRLNERSLSLESLPGRVGNLEGSVASLRGISTGARDAWLLAEAEYYMQIANAQLQLAGNPRLAGLALSFADERLLQLADPALMDVRRVLSDELRAIEGMERPDIEGVTLTLASLAGVVDSLPMRQEVETLDTSAGEVDPELSGMDRALASLKRAVGDVVSVRRTDEAAAPLTAPDAVYFLRANLALQLQAARLALLRTEKEIFEASLDDARDWLNRYYDTESAPVQSALETISEIRNGKFSVAPPDISESLRLLRQHVTLSESKALPAIEPEQDPGS